MMTHTITLFYGPNKYLSNFYVEPDHTHVEGEYQAAKCRDEWRKSVFDGLSPAQAIRLGRTIPLRADWEEVKLTIMHNLVSQKFLDHPDLAEKLIGTGDADIIESNWWGDTYWGVCHGSGSNYLGHILMDVRLTLRIKKRKA